MKSKILSLFGVIAFSMVPVFGGFFVSHKAESVSVMGSFDSGKEVKSYPSGEILFDIGALVGGRASVPVTLFSVRPVLLSEVRATKYIGMKSLDELKNYELISKVIGRFLLSPGMAEDAAAAQWAIWELASEDSGEFSLSGGRVSISKEEAETEGGKDILEKGEAFLKGLSSFKEVDVLGGAGLEEEEAVSIQWEVKGENIGGYNMEDGVKTYRDPEAILRSGVGVVSGGGEEERVFHVRYRNPSDEVALIRFYEVAAK